ncbi:hypothetical protein OH77DRAFT_1525164 [Trametes cingulata]|nr:hypothetical protein OH77DRAFT_1525164 [Trametes cingulata]
MSAPTCTIVIHPPAPTPASPVIITTTLGALCESIEDTRPAPFLNLKPGSLLSALQAKVTIPAEQFLRPPEMMLPTRRRKMQAVKPRVNPTRGRRLPDPWKVVSDSTGRLVLVPIQLPPEVPTASDATATAQAPAEPSTSPTPDRGLWAKGRPFTGIDDPRLVPWIESAYYLGMLWVSLQCTLIPLLF